MCRDRCVIIAEAGVNHNGDINIAYKLCDAAKEAGADVIKFQTYITEDIITKDVEQAEYQIRNTGTKKTQYEMLKEIELSYEDFRNIKLYCDSIGITFASTGDTVKDIDFLISVGIPFIKIGSGEIGNIPLLRHAGSKKLPIIMSTGMSSLSDVDLSIKVLKEAGATDITILHCTTSYPCDLKNVNLSAMSTIHEKFGLDVGYSDHTTGNIVAVAAVARGAKILEKHFTLDKAMEGPDHKASVTPDELKKYIEAVRNIEIAMGDGNKVPTDVEKDISKVVLKRIVAKKTIRTGQIITEDDVCVKRNESGTSCKLWDKVIGTVAKKDYEIDEGIDI